jgi:hypothetical protein
MYGIYANIWGILMGSMLPYIAAPWILWVIYYWRVAGRFPIPQAIFACELDHSTPLTPLTSDPRRDLAEWLRRSRRFVDQRAEGQPGRCFDEVMESTA